MLEKADNKLTIISFCIDCRKRWWSVCHPLFSASIVIRKGCLFVVRSLFLPEPKAGRQYCLFSLCSRIQTLSSSLSDYSLNKVMSLVWESIKKCIPSTKWVALEAKLDIFVMCQLQICHIQFRFATHVVKNCCLFFENLQTLALFAASCPLLIVCHRL